MPTIEERVARLEEHRISVDEKTSTLFEKFDALVTEIKELVSSLKSIETEHASCIRLRSETSGWLKGRFTKVLDAFLIAGLTVLLILILKNSGSILKTLGTDTIAPTALSKGVKP
jgi:hypothetical protein